MAGNLQPLRLFLPPSTQGVAPRLTSFPTSRAFFHQFQLPASTVSLITKVNRGSNFFAKDFAFPELICKAKPCLDFARKNFLPIALVSGISLGIAIPSLGHVAYQYPISKLSTIGIFFISGLMLKSEEISAAVEGWPAGILGLISILVLTPFFSRAIIHLPLNPREFVTVMSMPICGLAIFSCMPTTLSSGVALTLLAGGNSALALAMTVLSNFIGTLTVPFSLAVFVGGVGVSISTLQLCRNLVTTLLVPLVLGKVLRDFIKSEPSFSKFGVASFVDQNQQYFSMTSAILLSLVPGTQVSRSKSLLLTIRPEVFVIAVSIGILHHIILLLFNIFSVRILSILFGDESIFARKENQRAVIIVASQKTLPVMVAIVEQLNGSLGESGLLVLPCVAAHINQIIIDSFLVNWWIKSQLSVAAATKEE